MKHAFRAKIIATLFTSLMFYGCSSVEIIDLNPDNQALILKSEMSGLSPSQTNTSGNWNSTLEYINMKLNYGEKVFYSTTFKKFVHARFSDKFTMFNLNELNIEKSTYKRQGGKSIKTGTNELIIPAYDQVKGYEVFLASGKKSKATHLIIKVDVASDAIKVKQAFKLMSDKHNKKVQTNKQ